MRKRTKIVLGGFALLVLFLYGVSWDSNLYGYSNRRTADSSVQTTEPNSKDMEQEMRKRIQHKTSACKRFGKLKYKQIPRNAEPRNGSAFLPIFVDMPRYNLSYCNVGKAGGTFINRIFAVLLKGENNLKSLESGSRLRVHSNMFRYKRFTFKTNHNLRTITVGRNPFTRLFSAYIDRVSVPSITVSVRNGSKCHYDVTFEEFLKIVVRNTEKREFDTHWSPIYYLCRPCGKTDSYILKQESFSEDIQFFINSLNLTENQLHAIQTDIQQSRETWTITGVVKEMMGNADKGFLKKDCIGWLGALKRLWKAFQIQGYIDENVDFPVSLYNKTSDFSRVDIFLQTIKDVRARHPLTSEAKKAQRHRALVNAYKTVNREVKEDIKRVFMPDFEMFDYSYDPPN